MRTKPTLAVRSSMAALSARKAPKNIEGRKEPFAAFANLEQQFQKADTRPMIVENASQCRLRAQSDQCCEFIEWQVSVTLPIALSAKVEDCAST